MIESNFIKSILYNELHKVLGINYIFNKTDHFAHYPNNWNLEQGDIYYLIYLLQIFKPKRHLEFGTSIGTSTLATLQYTDATVWTLNCILENDKNDYFFNLSISLKKWLEKFGFESKTDFVNGNSPLIIGYRYLNADLGHRVNQIYCDSRKWDPQSVYPPDFFDTVFIDGGHIKELVINDTLKALSVLKSGGLIIWHDFNLEFIEKSPFNDVYFALDEIKDIIYNHFNNLYWIYPGFIIFGIKK